MAVKYQTLDDKLRKSPLSEAELVIIDEVEKHIDDELFLQYRGSLVLIDLNIANFYQNISRTTTRDISSIRRQLMYENLIERYNAAGWVCREEHGDSHEMYSCDYLEFTGKK